MSERDYGGLLFIGDPHLSSRVPGFRKDDYPQIALRKLRWSLELARRERLLPIILGDLFHFPRDNANWMMVELMHLLDNEILVIPGNHDCHENALNPNDTFSVLLAAGRMRCLDGQPWSGAINSVRIAVGGTSWGQPLPGEVDRSSLGDPRWVFWVAHHDVRFPGYEEMGRLGCREIAGVDLLINGHIHRALEDVTHGSTTWTNPGNITRVSRGDATRAHVPGVLRVDVTPQRWTKQRLTVPHEPFEQVFHPEIYGEEAPLEGSLFIQGLAALQKLKTSGGEGLREFLGRNLSQFTDERVRREISVLADEVLSHATSD